MSELRTPFELERKVMVETQLRARGISDLRVIDAMLAVPREEFLPESQRGAAYWDCPLPIGLGQTISQPYIVALMSEQASIRPSDSVLEIGTGSCYQTAVLAELAARVSSVEIIPDLSERAKKVLSKLGYKNITLAVGDGCHGWIESRQFDAILVTAAPTDIPPVLLDFLKIGGKMLIPLGDELQELVRIERHSNGYVRQDICSVRFVPMRHHDGDQKVVSSSLFR